MSRSKTRAVVALEMKLEQQRSDSKLLNQNLVTHIGQITQKHLLKHQPHGTLYERPQWMITPPEPGI